MPISNSSLIIIQPSRISARKRGNQSARDAQGARGTRGEFRTRQALRI